MVNCEYCNTFNEGDKYHPGTCANCGAPFSGQPSSFGKYSYPEIASLNNYNWPERVVNSTQEVKISLKWQ